MKFKQLLTKSLLAAVCLLAGQSAWGTPTIIKTYDFDAATDAVTAQTVLAYSGTTTINKIACDNLTGDWAGLAVQGAGNWHIYHANSKGVLQGNGYYNNNGGGRMFALLNLQAGDIVHITADAALPSTAINGNYDSEKSTAGSDCYYTVAANGNFAITTTERYHYIHVVTVTRDVADLETPTYEITGANGTERQVTLSCLTGDAEIKYNTTDDKDAPGWTTYSAPFYTAETTLYAYSVKSASTSDVIEITTGAGSAITLNAPTISGTFEKNGFVYNPRYSFSSNQSGKVIGEPTLTYTYSFNGGAATEGTSYSPSASGSLTVAVSAEGYTSNSTTLDVFGGDFTKTYFFDAINDVNVDTDAGTWGNASNIGGAQWTFTSAENCEYTLRDNMSLSGFMYARATTAKTKQGFYTRTSSGTINYELSAGEAIMFETLGDNIIANSSNTSQNISQYTNVRSINIFTPATEVDLAILDCKQHETSAAFAKVVDAETFATADEVYAFHTAWQIENASDNDITKVIFDAQVSDFSRWNKARSNSGQEYTGAPDNKYFDAWDSQVSDAKQKIYGLPAGNYSLKVATRASKELTDKSKYNIWVSGGSANVSTLGNHDGNTGGELGNGWSWTIIPFTLDAKADVEIGFYSLPGESSDLWAGADDWHLYKLPENVTKTISSAGWSTYCSPYILDFSNTIGNLEAAYIVTGGKNGVLKTTKVEGAVPANTGLLLKGTASASVNIPVAAMATATVTGNKLVGVTASGQTIDAGEGYVLMASGNDAAFYKNKNNFTLSANSAYLPTSFDQNAPAHASYLLFDDMTGISQVAGSKVKTNGAVYNLNGQRVSQPVKGLYIIDGKKVVIK